MNEVKSVQNISEGEYQGLLTNSTILECNFNCLSCMKIESEMSYTISEILRKFPRSVCERWNVHLSSQTEDIKMKPSDEFVTWLVSQRETWERMAAVEFSKGRIARSNFSDNGNRGGPQKSCFDCDEEGHLPQGQS